jgi:hypothetical protein
MSIVMSSLLLVPEIRPVRLRFRARAGCLVEGVGVEPEQGVDNGRRESFADCATIEIEYQRVPNSAVAGALDVAAGVEQRFWPAVAPNGRR